MPESIAQRREPAARHALVAVDRAIAELRRGAPVIVGDGAAAAAVLAAETLERDSLQRLVGLGAGRAWLALTTKRAAALGLLASSGPVALLPVSSPAAAEVLRRLADPTAETSPLPNPLPANRAGAASPAVLAAIAYGAAAIELSKLARLLPAAVLAMIPSGSEPKALAAAEDMLSVTLGEIAGYETLAARSLAPVGEARVPLAGAEQARIVAFRPADGGVEHLAIIIGEPKPDRPVLTRLHSACLTGDLLGSLRCDCGDQLQGAIAEIGRQGAGLLLYLAQEGRGIGLVNKLRAYRLQDGGADTVDANLQLGFDADERIYLPAAEMLRQLGFPAVRLMTNNPEKVAGLARSGITVVERVPHVFPANRHNEGYLETKATRFGHMF